MSLRTDIQNDLAEAFLDADQLLDVVESFNFIVETDQTTYDPVNDERHTLEEESPSKGVLTPVDSREVDGINIKTNDVNLVCNGTDVLISPKVGMYVELASGRRFKILDAGKIPSGDSPAIVYSMTIRADENRG